MTIFEKLTLWFGDKAFLRKLTSLTLPIALQSFMLAAVAAADSLMLGSIDENLMSAVSEASQIQFIQNMFLSSVVSGCTILGAQYWGKGDKKTVNDIFCIILRLNLLISVMFWAGCYFAPRTLMRIFTNQPMLIDEGEKYLKITAWSYLISGISQCYLGIMKVSEHASESARISIGAVILNIVLNAVFIYVFPFGVRGAALATLAARVAELIACIVFSAFPNYLRPSFKGLTRFYTYIYRDFAKCVLPVLASSLLWGAGFTSYTAFMGHMGEAAAANAVAAVVRDLVCCFCNGIAAAAGIIIGNELGAGHLSTGKLYGDRIMRLAFACGAFSALLMFALIPPLMSFIKLSPIAKDYFLSMMLVMSVYMIGRCVNTVVINGIFYCGGDIIFDTISLITTMWCLAVPLAWIGTYLSWPVWIVYACTCVDEVGKIPWVIYHYKKYKWVKDLTISEN